MQDSNIHIAFADDHDIVRESLIYLLNDVGGISVDIEANDGLELLEKLKIAERLPDICMIDIHMPNMGGYELLIQIREQWPDMGVLVLTAFDNQALVIRMIRAGANGYLMKSSKPSEVKEALQAIQTTGYYYSQLAPSAVFEIARNIKFQHFSEAEIDYIKYSCMDLPHGEIAEKMNTTVRGVDGYRKKVSDKLGVDTRAGIIMYAIQSGLVTVEVNTSILKALKNKNIK